MPRSIKKIFFMTFFLSRYLSYSFVSLFIGLFFVWKIELFIAYTVSWLFGTITSLFFLKKNQKKFQHKFLVDYIMRSFSFLTVFLFLFWQISIVWIAISCFNIGFSVLIQKKKLKQIIFSSFTGIILGIASILLVNLLFF